VFLLRPLHRIRMRLLIFNENVRCPSRMNQQNPLKQHVYSCPCPRCRALVWLIEDCGAALKFSATRAGRLCELAVVAAEGTAGMAAADVVSERRAYAKHLNVALSGPTSDANTPVHIDWAVRNSNHNPTATNRINLGQPKATLSEGRYRLAL